MSGEGTGGGGALALLLALWIGATGLVLGQGAFDAETPVAGEPSGAASGSGGSSDSMQATGASTSLECATARECRGAVTRAELATVFASAFELPVTTVDFFDDDDGLMAEAHINRFAAATRLNGCDERRFCPHRPASRGQLSNFLGAVLELPETDEAPFEDITGQGRRADTINRLAAAGILNGCQADRLCPRDHVTRGELYAVVRRALDRADTVA